jgi:hypothetical protein
MQAMGGAGNAGTSLLGAFGAGSEAGQESGGSTTSGLVSGATSGVRMGAPFGVPGMILGGVLGGATGYLGAKRDRKQARYDRKMLLKQEKIASVAREADRLNEFNDNMADFSAKRGASGFGGSSSAQNIRKQAKKEFDVDTKRDNYNLWMAQRKRYKAGKSGRPSNTSALLGAIPQLKELMGMMGKTKGGSLAPKLTTKAGTGLLGDSSAFKLNLGNKQ